jgi:CHAD domain
LALGSQRPALKRSRSLTEYMLQPPQLEDIVGYRLRRRESVSKGLKRVIRDELRSAREQLAGSSPSDDSIHEARKSIKKARAVLGLIAHHVHADGATRRLRRAGRWLSPIRDAVATIESARTLCAQASHPLTADTCSAIGRKLKQQRTRLGRFAKRADLVDRAARSIERVERSAGRWDWKSMDASTLVSEVRRSYKKARQGMREARGSGSPAFHEWRKRVKTLWYALRLLEQRVPVDPQLAELKRLEEWLGDDHNLVVLRARVAANGRPDLGQARLRRVRQLVAERQQELRRKALKVGARVFSERPKAFERHLCALRG